MTLRLLCFLICWLLVPGVAAQGQPAGAPPEPAAPEYLPNRGQWPAAVRLRTDLAPGLRLFAEDQRLLFLRYDAAAWNHWAHEQQHRRDRSRPHPAEPPQAVPAHAWAVAFVGARPGARPQPEGPATGPVRNYLTGPSPAHWATNVRGSAAARYHDLWPGVDLRLHGTAEGHFEYDLELKPGADPTRIGLRYEGLTSVRLDAKTGRLRLQTALGELAEAAPVAWQTDARGRRRPVPVRFEVRRDGAARAPEIGFALPAGFDRSRPLTIDPVLVFATHSGSTAPVFGHTATYDSFGHLYAAGPCYDVGYPTTLGAFDMVHSNGTPQLTYANPDVAISRYAPDGRTLRYATYLGGTQPDYPHSLLVNNRGELLVLGTTLSADFPTTATAYDTSFNNRGQFFYDLFVAKLDSTGSRLLGSTYVGGTDDDGYTNFELQFFYGDGFRGDLEVDSLDRVYVATTTASANFPFTAGAVRPARFQNTGVVMRLSSDLRQLDWAAGLGEKAAAYSLLVPASGAPYVVGTTRSAGFPTTAGTLATDSTRDVAFRQRDGFIAQLSPRGDSIRHATYLRPGTTGQPASQTFFVQGIPGSDDVVVLGSSTGRYPISSGRWGQPNGGLVMQRLSPDLSQRRWATTIGHPVTVAGTTGVESDNVSPTAFLVDRCGALYVSAWGRTSGLVTTANALQRTTDGQDLYMLVLDPDARALQYATYLGGSSANGWAEEHVDGGTSRFDPQGRVYQAICTNSANFPTTPGSWSPSMQVLDFAYDEISVKLDFERRLVQAVATYLNTNGSTTRLQAPATVQFVNRSTSFSGTTYRWNFGDGSATSTAFAPQHVYTRPGAYTATLIVTDALSCAGADTTRIPIVVFRPDSAATRSYAICRGDSVRFGGVQLQAGTFAWSPAATLSDSTITNPWAAPDSTTTYSAFGELPNSTQRIRWTITVTVRDRLQAAASATAIGGGPANGQQAPATVQFVNATNNITGTAWQWDFGDGSPLNTAAAPQHTYPRAGTFPVTLIARSPNACNVADTARLTITVERPDSVAAAGYAICRGDSVRFANVALQPGTFTWTPAASLSDSTITNPWAAPDSTTTYTASGLLPNSTQRIRWTITVTVRDRLRAGAAATAIGGGPANGQPAPATVQLVNLTPNRSSTRWEWRFGDGSPLSTALAPQHTFARAGTFRVRLLARDTTTCNVLDSAAVLVIVNRPDTAAVRSFAICRGDSVQLSGVLLQPGTFGWSPAASLSDSTLVNPWASPDSTTTYTAFGLLPNSTQRIQWSVTVTVRERLQAAASATAVGGGPANGQPAPATVQFVNATNNLAGTAWQWNFGDGSPLSTAAAPQHTYTRAGTFPVTLIAASPNACNAADTVRLTITVNRPDTTAARAYSICRGDSVQFSGVLLQPGSFTWTSATSLSSATAADPWAAPDSTTTYTAFGLLPNSTQRVTWSVTVTVRERLLAAASATGIGGGPANGQPAPATVQFVNATNNITGTAWQWNFGDGSPLSTAAAPQHIYARAGTFPVTLIAASPNACNAADTVRLTITVNRPDTTAARAYSICRGDSVQFSGVLLQPGSFTWTSATSLSSATAADPWASPDSTTTYTAFGLLPNSTQRVTWSVTVTVRERLLAAASATAIGGGPANGQPAPVTVQFVNATNNITGTAWQWNFGDGSPLNTAAAPQHIYARAGTFPVTLIAFNPAACNGPDTVRLSIVVNPADTSAALTYTICPGDSVQFGGLALQPGTFRWSPDSTLSSATAPNPWARPRQTTTYVATGQVAGQVRQATLRVTVVVRAVAPPTMSVSQRCRPGGTTATFTLSAPLQGAVWDFGDGSPASAPTNDATISHAYAVQAPAQTYAVTVRGRDADGCPVTVRQEVRAEALQLPNVITPGTADGLNDRFQLPCFEPGTATLRIFNRWGREVYDSGTNGYNNDWNAPDLPAGTYFYTLRLSFEQQEFRGWVEVVR